MERSTPSLPLTHGRGKERIPWGGALLWSSFCLAVSPFFPRLVYGHRDEGLVEGHKGPFGEVHQVYSPASIDFLGEVVFSCFPARH